MLRSFFLSPCKVKTTPLIWSAPRNLFHSGRRLAQRAKPTLRELRESHAAATRNATIASKGAATAAAPVGASPGGPPPNQSKLRQMVNKYGYATLFIYMGVSIADFSLCFGLVHTLGEEKTKKLENSIREFFGFKAKGDKTDNDVGGRIDMLDGQPEDSPLLSKTKEHKKDSWLSSTLLTELGVAFAIHKLLIFVRVPLTVIVTPPIVRALQRRGFQIGKTQLPNKPGTTLGTQATRNQRWFSGWFF